MDEMEQGLCCSGRPVRSRRQAQDLARWMRRNGWPFARAVECVDCTGWHAVVSSTVPADLALQRALAEQRRRSEAMVEAQQHWMSA